MTLNLRISDDLITLDINGKTAGMAKRPHDGSWQVTGWTQPFDRNQAITELTITELTANGLSSDHPLITALREELQ